jgi:hypothetical protein
MMQLFSHIPEHSDDRNLKNPEIFSPPWDSGGGVFSDSVKLGFIRFHRGLTENVPEKKHMACPK